MPEISGSVGRGGINRSDDVTTVQNLLQPHMSALGLAPLEIDGRFGDNTLKAIRLYQKRVMGRTNPDGRVDVDGATWRALTGGTIVTPPDAPAGGTSNLSGAAWWHANQARYPNSNKLADLAPSFRAKLTPFLDALRTAGATVSITAGNRDATRAYLMHFCWQISKGAVRASAVPPRAGCDIRWDHGSDSQSKRGAREMRDLFGIVFKPSLTSNHIGGEAVDMTIGWTGTLRVKDANGVVHALGAPRNGGDNRGLHAVGASYGVKKLVGDRPHWSATGT